MAKTYRLKIELGNDAMRTGFDIAGALKDAARAICEYGDLTERGTVAKEGRLRDINGHTVGSWSAK